MSANDLFDDLPALARLAIAASWRTTEWMVRSGLDATRGVLASLGIEVPPTRPPGGP
ncbi:MAG: hypothetical protein JWM71_480, partial [Solirubrobacteraceae bacterium]|nr:hypothetical protein [Solirubrobacteraceae bacterium]